MFTLSVHRLRRWTSVVLGLGFVLAASPAAANTWTALPHHGLNGDVLAVAVSGTDLYLRGSFTQTADGAVTNLNHIAKFGLSSVIEPALTDFRDVRRASNITVGADLGGTGHDAINFTGSAGSAGDTWITVYDPAPNPPPSTFGSVSLSADVLIHRFNDSKGAGLLALFNEATGKRRLALLVLDQGTADKLVLATVDQGGKLTTLESVRLRAGISENVWYQLTMDVAVDSGNVTVTGKVFGHTTPHDADSSVAGQIGFTLTFSGPLPTGVDASGEVGIIARAVSTMVDSSVANFTITP